MTQLRMLFLTERATTCDANDGLPCATTGVLRRVHQ